MAIDRTAFNAIVDSNGTPGHGSVWDKALIASALLDPIDAAFLPTYADWTPNDASGAGLTFTGVSAHYIKLDKLVVAAFELVYPSTVNGSAARIGGLPFTVATPPTNGWTGVVGYTDAAIDFRFLASGTSLFPYKPDGTQPTNANLSGKSVRGIVIFKSTA